MKRYQKVSLSFLLVVLLALTSSSPALSKSDTGSRTKPGLVQAAGLSFAPDIAVSGSKIHVVWRSSVAAKAEIYYKRSTDNGATWTKSYRLTRNAGDSYSPTIAVSGSNVHVVWQDDTPGNSEIYYKRSTNNGVSWGKKKRLTNNTGSSAHPVIAVSGTNIHVAWADNTPGNNEIHYRRSSNNGVNWGKTKRLTYNAGASWKPAIAVWGGDIHVVWGDDTPGNPEIFYKHGMDNGTVWGKTKRLTKKAGASMLPTVAVSGGNIHVVWKDDVSSNAEIFYRRSSDNGTSWSKKKRLTYNTGDSMNPVTVVSSGNVHVVWQDETPGNHDIYYKRSVNNGGTWGRNKRLTRNSGASSIPAIAVLGGNVHLVWVDDTSGEYKIFYRRSTDNGTTWGKKKKIVNLG